MTKLIGDGYLPDLTNAKATTIDENQGLNEASRVAVEQVAADWDKIRSTQKEQFIDSHRTKLKDDDLTIFSAPRKGCHYCYGTGVEGAYTNDSLRLPGQPCLCRCLTNKLIYHPGLVDDNRLTYKAFKQLMSSARQRYNLKEPPNEVTKVDASPVQGDSKESNLNRDEGQASLDHYNDLGQSGAA
jgi:hypothetical protein